MTEAELKKIADDAFAAAEAAAGTHPLVVLGLKTANVAFDTYVLPLIVSALKGRGVVA